MVKEQTARHVFNCPWDKYWPMHLADEAFNAALQKTLKLNVDKSECVWSGEGASRRLTRTLVMRPERNLPGFVEKLIKNASTVTEVSTYDPNTGTMTVEVDLPVVGSRTTFTGTYKSTTLPDGRHEQNYAGYCKVSIPLVGKKLEGWFMEEMQGSVKTIAAFAQRWLEEHPEAPGEAA